MDEKLVNFLSVACVKLRFPEIAIALSDDEKIALLDGELLLAQFNANELKLTITQNQPSIIQHFPYEVLQKIFRILKPDRLNSSDVFFHLSLVCKSWAQVALPLVYENIYIGPGCMDNFFNFAVYSRYSVKTLVLDDIKERNYEKVFDAFRNKNFTKSLVSVTLEASESPFNEFSNLFWLILGQCENLKEFFIDSWSDGDFDKSLVTERALKTFSNLNSLFMIFEDYDEDDDDDEEDAVESFSTILSSLNKTVSNLTKLGISTSNIADVENFFETIKETFPKVNSFYIYFDDFNGDFDDNNDDPVNEAVISIMNDVFDQYPDLKTLKIRLNDDDGEFITNSWPIFKELGKFQNLESLHVSFTVDHMDEFETLLKNWPNLKNLSFILDDKVSLKNILFVISQNCPYLEFLGIDSQDWETLDDSDIADWLEELPSLCTVENYHLGTIHVLKKLFKNSKVVVKDLYYS